MLFIPVVSTGDTAIGVMLLLRSGDTLMTGGKPTLQFQSVEAKMVFPPHSEFINH